MGELMQALRCHFISTILLLSLLGTAVVASGAEGRDPTGSKFVDDWDVYLNSWDEFGCSDDDSLIYEGSILGIECQGRGFDNQGNTYVALYSRYSTGSSSYFGNITLAVGFNIVKIDSDGSIISNTIASHGGGGSTSNRVLSLVIVSEDTYYLSINSYNNNLQWDFGNSISVVTTDTWMEILAYHTTSGWQWAVEAGQSSRYYDGGEGPGGLGNFAWEVASDSDLVTLDFLGETGSQSGCIDDMVMGYRIKKYSVNDGSLEWYRTVESCYASGRNLFMDGTDILVYFDSLGPYINLHGDTLDCDGTILIGNSPYTGCHMFAKISNSGQILWTETIDHTGVIFTKFNPVASGILLAGHWQLSWDFPLQNFTNYSGVKYWGPSGGPAMGVSIAKLNFNGNWDFHQSWTSGDIDDDFLIFQRVVFDDDNDFIITMPFQGGTFEIDSTHSVSYTGGVSYNTALFAYSSTGQYQWSTLISGPSSTILYGFAISGDNGIVVPVPVNAAVYFGSTYSDMLGTGYATAWFDVNDGTWVDLSVNTNYSYIIYGANSDHTFLAYSIENGPHLHAYTLDVDADDVPPSIDNCVDDWNPSQSDYDSDDEGDVCDDDDDDDGVYDVNDLCPTGQLGWTSTEVLDHDGDGCLDQSEEDRDDDNDGLSDQMDLCPVGVIGLGNDRDGDGCKDSEDSDDDNDGIHDGSDYCPSGSTNWLSGKVTDYDSDGCEDSGEDYDDDGDGVYDVFDDCPKGELGWSSNTNTDFDGDGCRDGVEDEDDDNDGVQNPSDECPNSVGTVDSRGCTVEQGMGGNSGGGGNSTTVIYYVCPGGTAVVLDLSDCPQEVPEQTDESENEYGNGSSSVTVDNGTISTGSIPTGLYLCPDRTALVTDPADCPIAASSGPDSGTSSDEEASMDTSLILIAGVLVFGTILLISLLIVSIVRVREMKAMRESGMYAVPPPGESNFEF